MACDHSGMHSHEGRYDRERGRLRYVVVCDACRETVGLFAEVAYEPRPVLGHVGVPSAPGSAPPLTDDPDTTTGGW